MYIRDTYHTIIERMREPRRFLQVIMGPRQVGKSTTVLQALKDLGMPYMYEVADNVPASEGQWIAGRWGAARRTLATGTEGELILVFDEIQKIYNWSEVVKKEWDSDTYNEINLKVILLGSSRVMLSKGLSESLCGRFEEIRMGHWSFKEMHEAFGFTLEQFIYFGGYPGAAPLIKNESRWRGYINSAVVDVTINKDILVDSPVSKPALLRQTFELSAAYSGKILSLTKMIGSLKDAGNTVTLAGYLNLLNDSGLVTGLQKYSVDLARRRASIPKHQVFNNALLGIFSGTTFKQAVKDTRLWGHLFESAVGAYILNSAFINRFEVCYWRDGDYEVDFVLKKYGQLVAIEVKSNDAAFSGGLGEFRKRFAPHDSFIVGRYGTPIEDFFQMDLNKLF